MQINFGADRGFTGYGLQNIFEDKKQDGARITNFVNWVCQDLRNTIVTYGGAKRHVRQTGRITRKSNQYALLKSESAKMRKIQKKQIENMLVLLSQAHDEIGKYIERKDFETAKTLLGQCQEGAVSVGELIEKTEGEDASPIPKLEVYCELIYQIYEELSASVEVNGIKIAKRLRKSLIQVENSVKNDISVRTEMVFLPYKVAMWDSLESVWQAADAAPDCDAYVVPIPYYDKNADGSLGTYHYEGDQFPDYVPVIHYDAYSFDERKPDAVFIHNPYDYMNHVTSVDPRFYSAELKKNTDCLVYIPYYATSGGMSDGQSLCVAYLYADYIVTQSAKYRKFFDEQLPDGKFLALGSPKFDSVIQKCKNPPDPPEEWKDKIKGRKVYFYNTSIGGMLENTENFLKKMEYVFQTFQGREDACLLWRPHPLLEATFDSMRREYKPTYEALKKYFLDEEIGIFDTTPDMENTIALSDVYVGDNASSVVSLFGVVGKPLFLLNNTLHERPGEDDWKGTVYAAPTWNRQNRYCLLPGNRLYYAPNNDFHYEYFCDVAEYSAREYYSGVVEYQDKIYILPANAQHILVVNQNKKIRRIELRREIEQPGAFQGFAYWEDKIYLYPYEYSSLVILELPAEKLIYIPGIRDFNVGMVNGEKFSAAKWAWRNSIYMLNVTGDKMLILNLATYAIETRTVPFGRLLLGACGVGDLYDIVALLPYEGTVITLWNSETGETKDIDLRVEGMTAIHRRFKTACEVYMFCSVGCCGERWIFAPNWSNKFVELNIVTNEVKEWIPPFAVSMEDKNNYFQNYGAGYFIRDYYDGTYYYFHALERKTYRIDLVTKEIEEVEISFDKKEILEHMPGFSRWSDWMQYMCPEDVFNSLEDLLDEKIHGKPFDKEEQIKAFAAVNASVDGDCGEKVYRYISEKING